MRLKSLTKWMVIPLLFGALAINNMKDSSENNMETKNLEVKEVVTPSNPLTTQYEIYPTPQNISYKQQVISLTKRVNVFFESGIDQYTKDKLYKVLSLKDVKSINVTQITNDDNFSINLGIYDSNEALGNLYKDNEDLNYINDEIDAYYLDIQEKSITILGKSSDAVFYGLASLQMIFEQSDDEIRALTIKDYSNTTFRGFIEGYYGIPWTADERMELMRFGELVKSNIYVYAPKDDSYHSSNWRGLYNPRDLKTLKEEIQVGKETKTQFAWAIHPFMTEGRPITSATLEEDKETVKAKFEQVYEAGARQFVISADDISVDAKANPNAYAEAGTLHKNLLNYMAEWNKSKNDLGNLIFVPTAYNLNASKEYTNYLENLVDELDTSVQIMWTGEKVCSSVAQGKFKEFKDLTGRDPMMWLNWPVNDYSTDHLLMGKGEVFNNKYIDQNLDFTGIVTNPMPQAEPSKLAIWATSDYAWNVHNFDMDKSYLASFKYLEQNTPDSLYEICQHLANPASKFEDNYFEESTRLALIISNYKNDLASSDQTTKDSAGEYRGGQLTNYFNGLIEDCDNFLTNGANKKLIKSMGPWVEAIKDMAKASILYIDIGLNFETYKGQKEVLQEKFNAARKAYQDSITHQAPVYNLGDIVMQNVDAGVAVFKPFLNKLRRIVDDESMIALDMETGIIYDGFAGIHEGNLDNITDGRDDTFCWFSSKPEKGAYVRIDLGVEPKQVHSIRILTGNGDGADLFYAKVEISTDAKQWEEVGQTSGAETVIDLRDKPRDVRFIRLVDNGTATWASIKEVTINTLNLDLYKRVTYTGWDGLHGGSRENIIDGNDETYCWFEGAPGSDVNKTVTIDLGEKQTVHDICVLAGTGNPADGGTDYFHANVQVSSDGTKFDDVGTISGEAATSIVDLRETPKEEIQYIKLVNAGTNHYVALREVKVNTLDMDLYNRVQIDGFPKIKEGIKTNLFDGDDESYIWFNGNPEEGKTITIDLGSIQEIHDVRVLSGTGKTDDGTENGRTDFFNAKVEVSKDGQTYEEVGKTGGIEEAVISFASREVQFIRLTEDGSDGFVAIREVSVNARDIWYDGYNGIYQGHVVDYMIDGDEETYTWLDHDKDKQAYIILDLKEVTEITSIKVLFGKTEGGDTIEKGEIQVSEDGVTWKSVEGGTINGELTITINLDEAITARYIRILDTQTSTWVAIREIYINK